MFNSTTTSQAAIRSLPLEGGSMPPQQVIPVAQPIEPASDGTAPQSNFDISSLWLPESAQVFRLATTYPGLFDDSFWGDLNSFSQTQMREVSLNNALQQVSGLAPEQLQEQLASPEGRTALNIAQDQQEELQGRHKAQYVAQQRKTEQERQQAESDTLNAMMPLATAAEQNEATLVNRRTLIQQSSFDDTTKGYMLNALENGRINTHDNPEYTKTLHTRLAKGETISDNDLKKGVLEGNLTVATMERVKAHQQAMQGPNRYLVQHGMQNIDALFASLPPPATSEEAAERIKKHAAAHDEFMYAVEEGKKNGTLPEMLETASPKNVLAGIIQRQLAPLAAAADISSSAKGEGLSVPTEGVQNGNTSETAGVGMHANQERPGAQTTSMSMPTKWEHFKNNMTEVMADSIIARAMDNSVDSRELMGVEKSLSHQQMMTLSPQLREHVLHKYTGMVEIGGYQYDPMSVTQDFDFIVRIIKEFYHTGDVSEEVWPHPRNQKD